jgi:hypothetical protein
MSLALTENARSHASEKAVRTAAALASSVAWSVSWTGVPNRAAAARSDPAISGRRSASRLRTRPT